MSDPILMPAEQDNELEESRAEVLTVTAEFVHPDADIAELSGRMTSLTDLVPAKK